MKYLMKFLCLVCEERVFFVYIEDKPQLLEDVAEGDALPIACPLCCQHVHAVLLKKLPM